MKTMIRVAAGISAVMFMGVATNCSPAPYEVQHVYYHHTYHNDSNYSGSRYTPTYSGSVNYTPPGYPTPARSFEPVQRF